MRLATTPRIAAGTLSGIALLMGSMVPRHAAHADHAWCWDDPIVSINGIELRTLVGTMGDPDAISQDVEVARVVYTLPRGIDHSVLSVSNPYFQESVDFQTYDGADNMGWQPGQPIPVIVTVSFQSTQLFPAQIMNISGATTLAVSDGDTESTLTATFELQ